MDDEVVDGPILGSSGEVRWLDDDEQSLWRSYLRVTKCLWEMFDADLVEQRSVTLSEYEILVRLSESEAGSLRMAELASLCYQSKSGITHTVARLEQRDFVRRVRCSEDGRGRDCCLTEAGWAELRCAAPAHVASVRQRMMDRLDATEQRQLGQILDKLCAGLPPRSKRAPGG